MSPNPNQMPQYLRWMFTTSSTKSVNFEPWNWNYSRIIWNSYIVISPQPSNDCRQCCRYWYDHLDRRPRFRASEFAPHSLLGVYSFAVATGSENLQSLPSWLRVSLRAGLSVPAIWPFCFIIKGVGVQNINVSL